MRTSARTTTSCRSDGTYLETIDIHVDNEMYAEGKRQVKVYRFER